MSTPKLDRRQALAALGTVSLGGLLAACGGDDDAGAGRDVTTTEGATAAVEPKTSTPASLAERFEQANACTVSPELTEGPYYFDVDAIRTDITEDREGTPLRLALRVLDAESCEPIPNAIVDVWHCDATGLYSGFESASTGAGGGPPGVPTDEETYLRGAQATNRDGIAEFRTIYPGWYRGRTVHIHAKVHLDRRTVLTSQLFFDDAFSERVYAAEPYSAGTGRDTSNDGDGIFDERLVMTATEEDDGVLALLTFNVQRT
jgi:protocatechuate 3,4-dioxygenase beta subunit